MDLPLDWRRAGRWAALLLVVLAVAVAWVSTEDTLRHVVSRMPPARLVALLFLQVATTAGTAYGWHFLLGRMKPGQRLSSTATIYTISLLVESLTPSVKLGGEVARVYLSRRATGLPYGRIAGALLVQKYVSLAPFFLVTTAVAVWSLARFSPLPGPVWIALSLVALTVCLLIWVPQYWSRFAGQAGADPMNPLLAFRSRIASLVGDAASEARTITSYRDRLLLMGLSLLVWVIYPLKVLAVAGALGVVTDLQAVALATFSAYVVSMVPLLPGGLGTFEGTMVVVLTGAGVDATQAVAVTLVSRSVTFWFPLLAAAAYALGLAVGGWRLPDAPAGEASH